MKQIVLLTCFILIGLKSSAQISQPNILWIMTDDQRMDSNGYFNEITTGKKKREPSRLR